MNRVGAYDPVACDCVSEGTARPKLAFATRRNASRQATKPGAKYVGARRAEDESQTIGQGAQRLQHVFEHRPGAPPFMEHMEAACSI